MKKFLLSSKETAEQLHITRQTLSKWNLPAKLKIGGKTYYKAKDIERIKEVGLDQFLKEFNSAEKTELEEAFNGLGRKFQNNMIEIVNAFDIEKIYRLIMLDSVEWQEIKSITYGKFICVCENIDKDGSDLNYWVTNEDLGIAFEQMTKLANNNNKEIFRYNVLPREVFSALYERLLIYNIIIFSDADDSLKKKCEKKKNDILAYMMPLAANFEHD